MQSERHLNILPPTLLLALSALLSSALGVFRDHLLAKTFGATNVQGIYNLDAYYAAFRIPDFLYTILILGSVSAAFIPIFTQYKKENNFKDAWEFSSVMLNVLFLAVASISFIAFLFAPQVTKMVAAGFEPESFALTVKLMRIMLLSPLIFTLSAIFISLQDCFKTFFYRSLAPIFYNLGIIFAILYFGAKFGVVGVTWGVILGAMLNLLIQIPALFQIGYKHVWSFDFKRPDVRKALTLMVPRVMALGMYQISQIFYTYVASFLATGSITILYFANNLYSLPLAVIAVSFSITSFATFSELATEPTTEPFTDEMGRVIQQVLFLVFPATIGVLMLRNEIIDTVLLSGKFTAHDAALTGQVLVIMIVSLFTHSLILLLTRGFYAYHNTKLPFYASLVGALVGAAFGYLLAIPFGYGVLGIAFAISLSNILVFLVLYVFLQKQLGREILDWFNVLKIVLASLLMGQAVYLAKFFLVYPETTAFKFAYLILVSVLGMLAYFIFAYMFNIPQRESILAQIRRML